MTERIPAVVAPAASMNGHLRFAHFELRPAERLLLATGAPMDLGSRAFDLLLAFVERPGELIRKSELMDRVWPRAVVTENNLHVQVSTLRRLLGVRAIVSISGHGYRFTLEVQASSSDPAPAAPRAVLPAAAFDVDAIVGQRTATMLRLRLCNVPLPRSRRQAEELDEVLCEFETRAREVLARRGGLMHQFEMHGMNCLFGLPAANEGDPVQAVETALELMEAVSNGLSPHASVLCPALALCGGLAHAGTIVSRAALPSGWRLAGHLPALAAALCDAASTDQLLVSESTHDRIAPFFETAPRPPVRSATLIDAIASHAVLGRRRISTRLEAARWLGFTPLAGRDGELATLRACLDGATAGSGRAVLVVADAGLGKSRLLEEFKQRLADGEATVLHALCQPHRRMSAYAPFVDLLRSLLQLDGDGPAPALAVQRLLAIDARLEPWCDVVLELLSMRQREQGATGPQRAVPRQHDITDAIVNVLAAASLRGPMLLILDDWHWVDEASGAVLQQIVHICASHRILLVVTARPQAQLVWPRLAHCTEIRLQPLDRVQSAAMMCNVASAQGSPDAVIDALHARAEGNPFFIEELCRSLIAGGALDARDGQLLALQPLSSAELPSSIEAVVQCRLDQLSHDALSLVRRACIIGREFSLRELAALCDPEDDLSAPIELLVNVALIEPTQVMPQRCYRFKHATTQLVAYESLPPKRRREDHRRIGTMLAQADAGVDACLDTIAYHFVCSDDHAMAIDYSLRAGVHAADRAAHSIAARHIRRAVELLEQDGATSQDDERLIEAYVKLGQSMHYLQGLSGLDVMRACERANLASRGANVNDGVFLAVAMLWRHEYQRSNLTEARNLASQLLGMARASPDPGRHLVAYCAHGVVEFLMGDYPKARRYLDIALEHYDEGVELRWIGRFSASLAVVAMTFKGLALTNLGEFSAAERVCRGACALAAELHHPESHCFALFYLGQSYIAHDLLTEAIRTNDELLAIATECQLPYPRELERLNRGICMIRSNAGSPQQAIQMLGQSADAIIALGVTLIAPQYHCAMAEIFAAIGQPAHAHGHLRRADEAVRAMGRCQFEPDVERARGVVAALKDTEGALPHFERALAMTRDSHSRLKQLRFALGLVPLLRALGREDTARTVLCEAQHGLQDEAHWPLVARVQQMLAELPSSERRELEAAGHPPAHQA